MSFTVVAREEENGHIWTVALGSCDPADPADPLVALVAALVRESYGETEILEEATLNMASEIEEGLFSIQHLITAIRSGLPDPDAEGNKPPALTTYRSQSAELVAKAALATAYGFEYPAAPQQGATNPNQPILGFDGWGLLRRENGAYILILIQVKATDDPACPPSVATALAHECCQASKQLSALARLLSVLVLRLSGSQFYRVVLRMLERLGQGELPPIHIAPAIVRGTSNAQLSDLQPIRDVCSNFAPATARGIVVRVSAPLADFGELVMRKAREAA